MNIQHPAKYSDELLPIFYKYLANTTNVFDPMAGTCKISELRGFGYTGKIYCNELEPEWAELGRGGVDAITTEDAAFLPYKDNFFDAICTSPAYGNRMADSHNAKDGSKRITYTHCIGRKLNPENTGQMQWGEKYREKHIAIWTECIRVLKSGGIFILNVSDHIRRGKLVPVTNWHKQVLLDCDMELIDEVKVETKRLRFGANAHLRVNYEVVFVFKKY